MDSKFDLCVIGGGPGGYVAAIRAGQLGAKVILVENEFLGGTCLNWGCIPTKALIAGAEVLEKIKHAGDFGIHINGKAEADWPAMINRKNLIVEKLRGGIALLLKSAGVSVIQGFASFADSGSVNIVSQDGEHKKVYADKFIIATGSRPTVPAYLPKSERILTSTDLLSIDSIPQSLIVLGGGVIGCEFACLFAKLGAKVSVVELMPSILPTVDSEVSKLLAREMRKLGIKVFTGMAFENVKVSENSVSGSAGKENCEGEYLLVSVGRKPSTEKLNLESAGVRTNEKGWIPVDSQCRTNISGIYAIGDITGKAQLAHFASAMGVCAAENCCGIRNEIRDDLVPGCIFTSPEIGTVGLSEEQCREKGININIGKFPFAALGKAIIANETSGFCKIIADAETDKILGAHIIGPHATNLIAEAVTAMNLGASAEEFGKAIHPHPTLSEGLMEAAHAVHGKSIHIILTGRRKFLNTQYPTRNIQ